MQRWRSTVRRVVYRVRMQGGGEVNVILKHYISGPTPSQYLSNWLNQRRSTYQESHDQNALLAHCDCSLSNQLGIACG